MPGAGLAPRAGSLFSAERGILRGRDGQCGQAAPPLGLRAAAASGRGRRRGKRSGGRRRWPWKLCQRVAPVQAAPVAERAGRLPALPCGRAATEWRGRQRMRVGIGSAQSRERAAERNFCRRSPCFPGSKGAVVRAGAGSPGAPLLPRGVPSRASRPCCGCGAPCDRAPFSHRHCSRSGATRPCERSAVPAPERKFPRYRLDGLGVGLGLFLGSTPGRARP